MEAPELRINNLVDLGNRIAKVTEINHLSCVVVDLEETQDTVEDYERVKGIILTEEWLLKFGFMKFKGGISLDNEEFTLTYTHKNTDKTILLEINGEDEWGRHQYTCIVLNNIKYVHQLQNLYFALTGEELTIN